MITASGFFVELQDRFFVPLVLLLASFASPPTVKSTPAHPQRFTQLAHFAGAAALVI